MQFVGWGQLRSALYVRLQQGNFDAPAGPCYSDLVHLSNRSAKFKPGSFFLRVRKTLKEQPNIPETGCRSTAI